MKLMRECVCVCAQLSENDGCIPWEPEKKMNLLIAELIRAGFSATKIFELKQDGYRSVMQGLFENVAGI